MYECLFPSPNRRYELPWTQKAAYCVFFGAMLVVAITGNSIVLWIVLGNLLNFGDNLRYFRKRGSYKI